MPVVLNRSQRKSESALPIISLLESFDHIDELQHFAVNLNDRCEITEAVAHADGTHDLIVAIGSRSDVFTFTVTCSGKVLSATVWDRLPSTQELVLQRCQDFAHGKAPDLQSAGESCRFGGHERAVRSLMGQ